MLYALDGGDPFATAVWALGATFFVIGACVVPMHCVVLTLGRSLHCLSLWTGTSYVRAYRKC